MAGLRGETCPHDVAEGLLSQALLPCLVWRAGKIAAASRFAAITAVATIFRTKLIAGSTAARLLHHVSFLLATASTFHWSVVCR